MGCQASSGQSKALGHFPSCASSAQLSCRHRAAVAESQSAGFARARWKIPPRVTGGFTGKQITPGKASNVWALLRWGATVGSLRPRFYIFHQHLHTRTLSFSKSRGPWLPGLGAPDCGQWYLHKGIYMFRYIEVRQKKKTTKSQCKCQRVPQESRIWIILHMMAG